MSSSQVANAANVTPVLLRTGPTEITAYHVTNKSAAARYLKLYDAAKATDVTVGTTLPDIIIPLAAGALVQSHVVAAVFQKGLVMVTTTGVADTDTAAGSARDIVGHITYGAPLR